MYGSKIGDNTHIANELNNVFVLIGPKLASNIENSTTSPVKYVYSSPDIIVCICPYLAKKKSLVLSFLSTTAVLRSVKKLFTLNIINIIT